MYSPVSNNIELINVNSVTEQEMQSFPNEFLKSVLTNWDMYSKSKYVRFIHLPAYSGIFRYIKAYSGIFRNILNPG